MFREIKSTFVEDLHEYGWKNILYITKAMWWKARDNKALIKP